MISFILNLLSLQYNTMKIILLSIVLLALAFAGIAVKILLKKDGKFAGTCSRNNPRLQKEGAVCGVCGAKPDEQCKEEPLSGSTQ